MTNERERPTPPGFAAAPLHRLVSVPTSVPPRSAAIPRRSNRWQIVTVSMLAAVFLGLTTYVVMSPIPPVVIANAATDAKLSTPRSEPPTIPLGSQSMWARDAVAPTQSTTPMPAFEPRKPGVLRGLRVNRPPSVGGPVPPPIVRNDDLPAECVLDPHLPKCPAATTVRPPVNAPAKPDTSLPNAPSQSALRAGVAPVKAAAKACGAKHGATPGEKVRVKLSVAGPTGAVVSTQPEAPHHGTPLGNCAAAALKKATFDKFQKPVIGLVYTITM